MRKPGFTFGQPSRYIIGIKRAYTLIELLVVISIIGVLMTVGVYSYNIIAARSRDNDRKADLARIQNALQQHYLDMRSYPQFDTTCGGAGSGSPIYSAAWQLTGSSNHGTSDTLAPKYIAKIPEDPTQTTNFATLACGSGLTNTQVKRYLYVTNSDNSGPSHSPTMFGVLATLEKPTTADILSGNNNPLISSNTPFGPWFAGFNNYGPGGLGLTANYMVTGTVGR